MSSTKRKKMTNIKFRNQKKEGGASIEPASFIVLWQTSETLEGLYETVEKVWKQIGRNTTRSFYTNKTVGLRQLRARATKYRNKGVNLHRLPDEAYVVASSKNDWPALAELAKSIRR
jgi:hypothetical protein